jgi:LAO/AO transport system kinase
MTDHESLIDELLAGKHRALARVITKIENRSPGYRDLVSQLHEHTGHAEVIGITGSPGAGKSTLVDKMAATYRERGETVGVIAIDPSSPFTGGAVLGDRIRMASNVGDMDVFFRSMSARGSLGGLSTATTDAVKALDAFGKDKIIVETVGAGQNEIEIVKTADTVCVLVPPGSGDDVQMLKAGILEIADIFVVNKADMDGADRTVKELREMIHMGDGSPMAGHHGADALSRGASEAAESNDDEEGWEPPIVETVAKTGDGVEAFLTAISDHDEWLAKTGEREAQARQRYTAEIRTLLREDTASLLEEELEATGGLEARVEAVMDKTTDPYTVADEIIDPLERCVREQRDRHEQRDPSLR